MSKSALLFNVFLFNIPVLFYLTYGFFHKGHLQTPFLITFKPHVERYLVDCMASTLGFGLIAMHVILALFITLTCSFMSASRVDQRGGVVAKIYKAIFQGNRFYQEILHRLITFTNIIDYLQASKAVS